MLLALHAPAHLVGRGAGLGVGPAQLVVDLFEGAPNDGVGLQQPFPAGAQLLDLHRRHPPAPRQVLQYALAGGDGALHREGLLLLSGGPDGAGLAASLLDRFGRFGPGRLDDPRTGFGHDAFGVRGRPGAHIGRRRPGGPEDGRGLVADRSHQGVFVEHGRAGGSLLG